MRCAAGMECASSSRDLACAPACVNACEPTAGLVVIVLLVGKRRLGRFCLLQSRFGLAPGVVRSALG